MRVVNRGREEGETKDGHHPTINKIKNIYNLEEDLEMSCDYAHIKYSTEILAPLNKAVARQG